MGHIAFAIRKWREMDAGVQLAFFFLFFPGDPSLGDGATSSKHSPQLTSSRNSLTVTPALRLVLELLSILQPIPTAILSVWEGYPALTPSMSHAYAGGGPEDSPGHGFSGVDYSSFEMDLFLQLPRASP